MFGYDDSMQGNILDILNGYNNYNSGMITDDMINRILDLMKDYESDNKVKVTLDDSLFEVD